MLDPALLASLALLPAAPLGALTPSPPVAWSPGEPTWADFDADGRRDVLLVAADGTLHLFLAIESGRVAPASSTWSLEELGRTRAFAVEDLDGDGLPDLAVALADGGARVLRNAGAGFDDVTAGSGLDAGQTDGSSWRDVSSIDFDEDGNVDLLWTSVAGELLLTRNATGFTFYGTELAGAASLPDSTYALAPTGAAASEGGAATAPVERARPGGGSERTVVALPPGGPPAPSSTPSAHAPIGPAPVSGSCVAALRDAADGGCLPASSEPQPGHLLPLGPDFFVDSLGRVGFGTESPMADVHLHGGFTAALRVASFNPFAGDFLSVVQLGNGDFSEGFSVEARPSGLEVYSRRDSQGGPIDVGPHLTVRRQDATAVGIGTPVPVTTLDVAGEATVRDDFHWRKTDGVRTGLLEPERFAGGGARLSLYNGNGATLGARLDAQLTQNGGGALSLYRSSGQPSIELNADDLDDGYMRFYKSDNSVGVLIHSDLNGTARIRTETLEITGGADLVESFDTGEAECAPGTVLVIDASRPGQLAPSREPYDSRVAGVVSGAGGIRPGLHMGQDGVADGSTPVALTGRVFVRCNDEGGPVVPGDLLTTSSTPGEAMRVDRPERAAGATLGKAMTPLDEGPGLVLVLVSLQ